jgi:dTDP-4-dehydrorhamnose reductase
MKVLITGSGGQVGRALLDAVPSGMQAVGCSRAELDVADEEAVITAVRSHRPEVIVNAAAYTAVDRAESEPELARRVNALGPGYLARAAGEMGARLIHISTDFVFDGASSLPYRPQSPTCPLSVYGLTKRDGELAVLDALPHRSTVLRTAWVYAAEGRNFMRTMLRLMEANGAVRVVSDQVGTPTFARSVAKAIWKVIECPELTGVHHWTDAGVASWYDFAIAIAEEAATAGLLRPDVVVTPIATADYPTPARRPAWSVLDRSSLASLGIESIHWRRALRAALRQVARA